VSGAELYAPVADVDPGPGDQFADLVLALSTERAARVSGHDPGVRSWFVRSLRSEAGSRSILNSQHHAGSISEGSSPRHVSYASINHVNDATPRPPSVWPYARSYG
jgi:hypothetical protein